MRFYKILIQNKIKQAYKAVRYNKFNLTVFFMVSAFIVTLLLSLAWFGFAYISLIILGLALMVYAFKFRSDYKKYKFLVRYEKAQNTLTKTNNTKYTLKITQFRILFVAFLLMGGYLFIFNCINIYRLIF